MMTHIGFHLEPYLCYMQNSHVQIYLRMLNPHQILAIIHRNADGRVHVQHHPLINRSTIMTAAAGTAAKAATAGVATAVA